jgi:hypothetical protein
MWLDRGLDRVMTLWWRNSWLSSYERISAGVNETLVLVRSFQIQYLQFHATQARQSGPNSRPAPPGDHRDHMPHDIFTLCRSPVGEIRPLK